jgi:hypothetical protein
MCHFIQLPWVTTLPAGALALAGCDWAAPVDDLKVLGMMQVCAAAARPDPAHELMARTAGSLDWMEMTYTRTN